MRTPWLHNWNKALIQGIVASQRPEYVMTVVFLAATLIQPAGQLKFRFVNSTDKSWRREKVSEHINKLKWLM